MNPAILILQSHMRLACSAVLLDVAERFLNDAE